MGPEKLRPHLYNCMDVTPVTQEVKQLFQTEKKLLKTVFAINQATENDKSMGILSRLWKNLKVLRFTFLEEHTKCKVLVNNLEDDDEEDLLELFQLQAFEYTPGIEAIVQDLKTELEYRYQPYEFKLDTSEPTKNKPTTSV